MSTQRTVQSMLMERHEIAQHLKEDIDEARVRFNRALLRVENSRRRDVQLPDLPKSTPVWFPTGPVADLHLLTLDVWRIRYCVTAEFIIETIIRRFRNMRRLPTTNVESSVQLGLPANIMAGTEARRCLEERIAKDFPNQENIRVKQQPKVSVMPELSYTTIEEMLTQYNDAVAQVHKNCKAERKSTRPYRKVYI